jgi:DNA-binding MarR family transcriptional regulator
MVFTDLSRAARGTAGMSATKLDKDDKAALFRALTFVDAFRKLRPTMPLQHAYTFLLVAMEEGLGVSEYAEKAGVPQTVMTRHLLDMGTHTRTRQEGLGILVSRMDPLDMRKHQTYLTPEGRALLHKIIRTMS